MPQSPQELPSHDCIAQAWTSISCTKTAGNCPARSRPSSNSRLPGCRNPGWFDRHDLALPGAKMVLNPATQHALNHDWIELLRAGIAGQRLDIPQRQSPLCTQAMRQILATPPQSTGLGIVMLPQQERKFVKSLQKGPALRPSPLQVALNRPAHLQKLDVLRIQQWILHTHAGKPTRDGSHDFAPSIALEGLLSRRPSRPDGKNPTSSNLSSQQS